MVIFVIKDIRESKNISQYKLSKLAKVSRTYLRDLENNKKCNPSVEVLEKISKALNVNLKDLFYTALDVEELRKEMYKKIDIYGIDSKEVLHLSQIIDLLLNIKQQKS